MRGSRPSRTIYIVLGVLLVLLPLLAVLQYRWIGEVSQADRRLLEDNLNRYGSQFAEDFNRELSRVFTAFQIRGSLDPSDLNDRFSQRFEDWTTAPYTNLVRRIFFVRSTDTALELSQFDTTAGVLKPTDWPPELTGLRDSLQARKDRPDRRAAFSTSMTESGNPEVAIPAISDNGGGPPPQRGGFGRGGIRPQPAQPAGWTCR